jgi:hypothetical protein
VTPEQQKQCDTAMFEKFAKQSGAYPVPKKLRETFWMMRQPEIDALLASAQAAEGKMNAAISRMETAEEKAEIIKTSNARAHETAQREKDRADKAEELARDIGKDRDDAHAAWSALSIASDYHRKRIRELQAIVDRLPKTADGVPVIPLIDEVFMPHIMGPVPVSIDRDRGNGPEIRCDIDTLYSTREAALAANGGA